MQTLIPFIHTPTLNTHLKPTVLTMLTLLTYLLLQSLLIFGLTFAYLTNGFFFTLLFIFFDVPHWLFFLNECHDEEPGNVDGDTDRAMNADEWHRICPTDDISEFELESSEIVAGDGEGGRRKVKVDRERVRIWAERISEDKLEDGESKGF